MKILHLSTSDTKGGAARAAYRLHSGLKSQGVDSSMLVQYKNSEDEDVYGPDGPVGKIWSRVRRKFDRLPSWLYSDRDPELFSSAWTPENRGTRIKRQNPDIIHLHWIAAGFLKPATIGNLDVPIVWTLHDMWPFTGGCHYSKSCSKYRQRCGKCPHLGSTRAEDLSRSVWQRKYSAWESTNFHVVGPSRWIANCAKKSTLFSEADISVIPNGLNVDSFRPEPSDVIRTQLSVDNKTNLVGFAFNDAEHKGMDLMHDAINLCDASGADIQFVQFGSENETVVDGKNTYNVGFLDDDDLRALYNEVDAIVVPTRTETFGQVASEALASGTPVVAFDATGPKDIVNHKTTGYLAEPFDPRDLVKGIKWVVQDSSRNEKLSHEARKAAEERFSIRTVASQYEKLYKSIIK